MDVGGSVPSQVCWSWFPWKRQRWLFVSEFWRTFNFWVFCFRGHYLILSRSDCPCKKKIPQLAYFVLWHSRLRAQVGLAEHSWTSWRLMRPSWKDQVSDEHLRKESFRVWKSIAQVVLISSLVLFGRPNKTNPKITSFKFYRKARKTLLLESTAPKFYDARRNFICSSITMPVFSIRKSTKLYYHLLVDFVSKWPYSPHFIALAWHQNRFL